jgi:hypothetical protein
VRRGEPGHADKFTISSGLPASLPRYNVEHMNTSKPAVAAVQGLLISPAVLFMGSLVVRGLPLPQYELAQNAQRVVLWYSARLWTLWVLLILLPMAVLVTGCLALFSTRSGDERMHTAQQALVGIRSQFSIRVIATATLMSAGILAIVVLHMLAN